MQNEYKRPVLTLFCILHSAFCIYFLTGCNSPQPAQPQSPQSTSSLVAANNALSSNMPDAAIADAQSYLRALPNGTDAAQAWYLEGCGYEMKVASGPGGVSSDLSQAKTCYLEALQQNPPAPLQGDIHASISNVDFFQDDFVGAIDQATAAMPLVPSQKTKSFLLYRIGVSQQRLSRFTDADQTFRQVQQRYPGTPAAMAAHEHEGQSSFYVQLATYNSKDVAERAMASLHSSGVIISQRTDARGNIVIDDGPFPSYAEAKTARNQLLSKFPQALIVP